MGMYDTIIVVEALPLTEEMKELGLDTLLLNGDFQTKDLDNTLGVYVMQSGKLFLKRYKIEEWVGGDEKSPNWLDRIGYLKREDEYLDPVKYHGTILFYHYIDDLNGKWDCWVEYEATFTEGELSKIELVKFEKTDNTERKQRQLEQLEEARIRDNLWYNKYFLHTKVARKISLGIYKLLQKIGNFFIKLSYRF